MINDSIGMMRRAVGAGHNTTIYHDHISRPYIRRDRAILDFICDADHNKKYNCIATACISLVIIRAIRVTILRYTTRRYSEIKALVPPAARRQSRSAKLRARGLRRGRNAGNLAENWEVSHAADAGRAYQRRQTSANMTEN